MWWALALVIVLLVWIITGLASRLDRLHGRIAAAHTALDAQLVRRAWAAIELARLGVLDPAATLVITESATLALDSSDLYDGERQLIESELSRALRAGLGECEYSKIEDDELGLATLHALASAFVRVEMTRRFHNDAVVSAVRIRRKTIVRLFRLAGRAQMPTTVELDDELPPGLRDYDVRVGL